MFDWIESHPAFFAWAILPLMIYLARICDVTLGTGRTFFVSRGYKKLAAVAGFWEVLIWLIVIGQIMKNLTNPMCYIAYAAGYSTGVFVGMTLIEKLSLGVMLVRILTHENADALIDAIKARRYGITTTDGAGALGPMKIILTIVPRRAVADVVAILKTHNPNAFYSIEEISEVSKGKLSPYKLPGLRCGGTDGSPS
ncbi:MAG: DUF2179 domain-containing protein [Planctomycetaceae bacterium]|nr:DUF2179 domain-containing protein [Planctomycetaceae bacterium]